MKKIISLLMVLALLVTSTDVVFAKRINTINSKSLLYIDKNVEIYLIHENNEQSIYTIIEDGVSTNIIINKDQNTLQINNQEPEKLMQISSSSNDILRYSSSKLIENNLTISSGPTKDTNSGAYFEGTFYVITIYITALAICAMMGGATLSGVISSLQNWPASVDDKLILTFTQYSSIESYYSSYYNTYYKKARNENNSIYYNAIGAGSRMYYLAIGNWFDPIRVA